MEPRRGQHSGRALLLFVYRANFDGRKEKGKEGWCFCSLLHADVLCDFGEVALGLLLQPGIGGGHVCDGDVLCRGGDATAMRI